LIEIDLLWNAMPLTLGRLCFSGISRQQLQRETKPELIQMSRFGVGVRIASVAFGAHGNRLPVRRVEPLGMTQFQRNAGNQRAGQPQGRSNKKPQWVQRPLQGGAQANPVAVANPIPQPNVALPGRAFQPGQPAQQAAVQVRNPAQVVQPVNPVQPVPVNPVQPVPVNPVQPQPQAVAPVLGKAPRFGNETFGYDIKVADEPVRLQFTTAIEAVRKEAGAQRRERVKKNVFDKPEVQLAKGSEESKKKQKERSTAAMVDYPKALATPSIVEQLAADSSPAATNFRKLYILGKPADGRVPVKTLDDKTHVADLLLGLQAFRETGVAAGGRKTFEKLKGGVSGGGEYVGDDANVPTRRYAYVETSRQQMMAALGKPTAEDAKPAMRGRYQRHRTAMGLEASPLSIDQARDPELARLYGKSGVVSKDVMANVHQFLGSGLNQRGVSLTSTPKKEVISNDGDPFDSPDGVRLKVDLSLVPDEVILLNHYAVGGVGTRLEKSKEIRAGLLTKQKGGKGGKGPRDYNYAQSVVKNRELLLTELRPEWIVEVSDRLAESPNANKAVAGPGAPVPVQPQLLVPVEAGKAGAQPGAQPEAQPVPTAEQRMETLRGQLGHEWYELGRADGAQSADGVMKAPKTVDDPFKLKNYDIGFKSGVEERAGTGAAPVDVVQFWAGFDDNAAQKVAVPGLDPTAWEVGSLARKNAKDEWAELQRTRPAWFVLSSLRALSVKKKKFREKMHDSFWIAWAAAAKNVPPPPVPVVGPAVVVQPPVPVQGFNRPGQPVNRPGQGGNRPGQGGNRPGQAGNRPGQAGNRPGQPGNRPGQSGNQAGNGRRGGY